MGTRKEGPASRLGTMDAAAAGRESTEGMNTAAASRGGSKAQGSRMVEEPLHLQATILSRAMEMQLLRHHI